MLDRERRTPLSRRSFLTGLGAVGAAFAFSSARLKPAAAEGSPTLGAYSLQGEEALEEDVPEEELLVVEEDADFFKGMFGGGQDCRVQVEVTAMGFKKNPRQSVRQDHPDGTPKYHPAVVGDPKNPGDIIAGPAPNRRFFVNAFNNRVSRGGESTDNSNGQVLFIGHGDTKPTRRLLEFRGRGVEGKLPVVVGREGGSLVPRSITCERKQRFPFLIYTP